MDCSCDNKVKSAELFREEYGDLINEIKMYKYHFDKKRNIPCSSCEYGKVMWELTVHKSARKR